MHTRAGLLEVQPQTACQLDSVPTGDVSLPDICIHTIPSDFSLSIFTLTSLTIASSSDAWMLSLTYSTVPLASDTSVFYPKD
jgi:hypothetical protein